MELEKEDLRDRQENEVEALKAIFADDFEDIRENEVGKICAAARRDRTLRLGIGIARCTASLGSSVGIRDSAGRI